MVVRRTATGYALRHIFKPKNPRKWSALTHGRRTPTLVAHHASQRRFCSVLQSWRPHHERQAFAVGTRAKKLPAKNLCARQWRIANVQSPFRRLSAQPRTFSRAFVCSLEHRGAFRRKTRPSSVRLTAFSVRSNSWHTDLRLPSRRICRPWPVCDTGSFCVAHARLSQPLPPRRSYEVP